MTHVEGLQKFGYAPHEAHFLRLAALHSGYFLRRQFLSFVSGTKGWQDVALLKKLTANRHCRAIVYRHNRMIYHLSAKPLYEALGEKDNRNRREHQPSTIKNKIMALDFVLAHPGHQYLATEGEKLGYFVRTVKITPEHLPTRWFTSPRTGESSAKHFADKYPVFLAETGQGKSPLAHLCFVDEGLPSTDRFETYLRQYRRLFVALADFRVIYVAQPDGLFDGARRCFEGLCEGRGPGGADMDADSRRLLDYFAMRREYEAQDFSRFDTARVIRYREARKLFAGEEHDGLYAKWQDAGNAGVPELPNPVPDRGESTGQRFSTYVLGFDYDLFGTFTVASQRRVAATGGQTQH